MRLNFQGWDSVLPTYTPEDKAMLPVTTPAKSSMLWLAFSQN